MRGQTTGRGPYNPRLTRGIFWLGMAGLVAISFLVLIYILFNFA
ncbi:Hypothetical Protein RradSPS_0439 [Rubrobacter radiotolerans]|uniref:Uncharacterized protein n=1 Tax=Rubrobacter radiotolerans TaxID=42256 RepID=A0A023WZR8_RUBRA|nr:hypothetical protein [Rubrobacter radiotolerans]AHY45722.1 Hypothetical Protein RradSPS_0439 [Rubrobacter radiotolerans]MDX5893138.1 hypothetical protein [Rubrobacter radiotolerans]SMC03128.1 4Fe-4S ferredoxin, iron-sulfur cluster binding protein [Rubrobacter radiotolerans DSM 5868]